jgi:hypothetical protein
MASDPTDRVGIGRASGLAKTDRRAPEVAYLHRGQNEEQSGRASVGRASMKVYPGRQKSSGPAGRRARCDSLIRIEYWVLGYFPKLTEAPFGYPGPDVSPPLGSPPAGYGQ